MINEHFVRGEIKSLLLAEQTDSIAVLASHYQRISKIRQSPKRGAQLLERLASHEHPSIRANAAWMTTHLARDLILASSDIWSNLGKDPDERVRKAALGAVALARDFQYITQEEATRILGTVRGLRTLPPRDLPEEQKRSHAYRFAGYEGPAIPEPYLET